MLCSMGTMVSLLGAEGPAGVEIGAGGGGTSASVGVRASEGACVVALRDPGNVMEGSSGFQQFFLI